MASCARRITTAGWATGRAIRNCSITWRRRFMENGWSIKKMHRLIMLSKTYQMSAAYDEETKAKDPENRLLSHFPRQRLSIEEIRDAYLAMGGDLDLTMGGTLDPGVGTDGETSAGRISMNPEKTNRRSIYLPLRRSNLPTLYTLFDFGDATTPEGTSQPHDRRHAGAVRDEQPAGDSRGEERRGCRAASRRSRTSGAWKRFICACSTAVRMPTRSIRA